MCVFVRRKRKTFQSQITRSRSWTPVATPLPRSLKSLRRKMRREEWKEVLVSGGRRHRYWTQMLTRYLFNCPTTKQKPRRYRKDTGERGTSLQVLGTPERKVG